MSQKSPFGIFAGRVVEDIYIFLSNEPEVFDGKNDYDTVQNLVGGSGPNAAITFGYLNKNLGYEDGNTILYTALPQNMDRGLKDDLTNSGVVVENCTQDPDYQLRQNYVISGGTSRRIARDNRSIHAAFNDTDIKLNEEMIRQVRGDLSHADIFMMGTRFPALTLQMAEIAHEMGVPVLLDAGEWKEHLPALVQAADIVIASHDVKVGGCNSSAEEILAWLKGLGIKYAAVTQGKKPTLYDGPEGKGEIVSPEFGMPVVDTSAAGDIQKGAFAHAFVANGNQFVPALEEAAKVASWSVVHRGSRAGLQSYGIDSRTLPQHENGVPVSFHQPEVLEV